MGYFTLTEFSSIHGYLKLFAFSLLFSANMPPQTSPCKSLPLPDPRRH